jgi:hypothetical protein
MPIHLLGLVLTLAAAVHAPADSGSIPALRARPSASTTSTAASRRRSTSASTACGWRGTGPAALRAEKYFGRVGAFQGASYEAKGLYRPEADCIMFSRNPKTYYGVCAQAIERAIGMFKE